MVIDELSPTGGIAASVRLRQHERSPCGKGAEEIEHGQVEAQSGEAEHAVLRVQLESVDNVVECGPNRAMGDRDAFWMACRS